MVSFAIAGRKNRRISSQESLPSVQSSTYADESYDQEQSGMDFGMKVSSESFGSLPSVFTIEEGQLHSKIGMDDLIIAAAHIEDAQSGRGTYGKAQYYYKPRHAQIAFNITINKWFERLIFVTVLLHSGLTFIEPPSSAVRSVESYIALGLNLVCLLIYLADIILTIVYLSWKIFWTTDDGKIWWSRVEFVLLCGFTIDWILLIAQVASQNGNIIQPFRCLRLAMVMCKAKNVAHIFHVVKSITVKLGGVVMVVFIFILLYSCIGVHLVMRPYADIPDVNVSDIRPTIEVEETSVATSTDTQNGTNITLVESVVFIEVCSTNPTATVNESNIYEGTFDHIGPAAFQLFVLLTTENFPVIMFPAYTVSKWYFAYFGSFLFFGVFLLTAILLAIIADLYWQYSKKHVKKERLKQRALLVKAWKLLDTLGEERLSVDDPQLLQLFQILKPKNSTEENKELINELDPDENGYVDWIQWVTQLLGVLSLETTSNRYDNRRFKKLFSCGCCVVAHNIARKITSLVIFEKIVLVLIVLHSVFFTLKWNGMSFTSELVVQALRTSIMIAFLFEMLLRTFARGLAFFTNMLDIFDFILVIAGFLSNIAWYVSLGHEFEHLDVEIWRGFSVVLSSLAIFCRLFFNSAQSRRAMIVFYRLFPVMLDLIILFGIIMYLYAVIGMESFHSFPISSDTPTVNHLQYRCGLGFSNFLCSLFMVFQILTTSNWHEIMNAIILSLDTFAPLIYFFSCYIVINLIIMNLLVAIGIEAFNKFSEEQKAADRNEEDGNTSGIIKESGNSNGGDGDKPILTKEDGKLFLRKIANLASVMFSSTRQHEESEEVEDVFWPQRKRSTHSAPTERNRVASSTIARPKSMGGGGRPILVQEFSPSHHDNSTISLTPLTPHTPHSPHTPLTPSVFTLKSIDSNHTLSTKSSSMSLGSASKLHAHQSVVSMIRVDTQEEESLEDETRELQSPHTPTMSVTIPKDNAKSRQEKLRKQLKEKQKQKLRMKRRPSPPSKKSSQIHLQSGYDGDEDTVELSRNMVGGGDRASTPTSVCKMVRKNSLVRWGSATKVVTIVNKVAEHSESVDQFEVDDSTNKKSNPPSSGRRPRRGSINNGRKFRKAYNHGNWRSEVQNITIINKEELSQLRQQLNSTKPGFRRRSGSTTATVDSIMATNPHRSKSPQSPNINNRHASITTLNFSETEEDNYMSGRRRSSSSSVEIAAALKTRRSYSLPSNSEAICDNEESNSGTQVQEQLSSTYDGSKFVAKPPILAPLLSVEEVPEQLETEKLNSPNANQDERRLVVPGGKPQLKARARSGSKEVPEWVLKLTQQYNIALHTDNPNQQ